MKDTFDIFTQIESTSSRNDKESILLRNKDNELLKRALEYTYNPYKIYGIGKKSFNDAKGNPEHDDIFQLLDYLSSNNSSDATKRAANYFVNSQPEQYREWYRRMILKDLCIGVTEKTINKIWDKCIPVMEVMLAEKYWDYKDKILGQEFIVTMKLNGHRGIIIKDKDSVKMFTREGQPYEGLVEIEEDVKQLPAGYVYDGEFTVANYKDMNSKEVYKATSKAIRKDGDKTGIVFRMFDIIRITEFYQGRGSRTARDRKAYIHDLLCNQLKLKHIEEVPVLYQGTDHSIIEPLVKKVSDNGEEGIMLNMADAVYECKRTRSILKVKLFKDADVLVVGVIEGDSKNKGKLGAITVKFKHEGKEYECECGSGFSDEERVKYFANPELLVGKIVQIKYFEITSNSKGGYGLQFPTWEGIIRHDKSEISMY